MIERIVIWIDVSVEKVFQFMVDYDKHYTEIHKDHVLTRASVGIVNMLRISE